MGGHLQNQAAYQSTAAAASSCDDHHRSYPALHYSLEGGALIVLGKGGEQRTGLAPVCCSCSTRRVRVCARPSCVPRCALPPGGGCGRLPVRVQRAGCGGQGTHSGCASGGHSQAAETRCVGSLTRHASCNCKAAVTVTRECHTIGVPADMWHTVCTCHFCDTQLKLLCPQLAPRNTQGDPSPQCFVA